MPLKHQVPRKKPWHLEGARPSGCQENTPASPSVSVAEVEALGTPFYPRVESEILEAKTKMAERDEDLVWQLRSWSYPRLHSGGERIPALLMKEAADEIERLRAKVERLRVQTGHD